MKDELKKKLLSVVYIATIFYGVHSFSTYFILSTFLDQYFNKSVLSLIFAGSAILAIIVSNFFGEFLKRFTNYKTLMFILGLQFVNTIFLAFSQNMHPFFIGALFIMHSCLTTLIWVSISIFIEEFADDKNTGAIRGTILAIYNFGAIATPFVAAEIYNFFSFKGVFILSALAIIPLAIITRRFFHTVKEPKYNHINLFESLNIVRKDSNIRGVIASSFILNSFYAVVNVYLVLHIIENVGIPVLLYLGLIVPISIIPFVLIPYKLGKYSDEIFGEKRAMLFGITLLSIILISIYLFDVRTPNIFVWIAILFFARVGATITETENYAYFYKRVDGRNAGLIALFQNMVNVSFLFVTVMGAILINIFNIDLLLLPFIIGLFGFVSMAIIIQIRDTEVRKRRERQKVESFVSKVHAELKDEEERKEMLAEKVWRKEEEERKKTSWRYWDK